MCADWFLSPLFRVAGRETSGAATDTAQKGQVQSYLNPEFRLIPTKQYYVLVVLGVSIVITPILASAPLLGITLSSLLFAGATRLLLRVRRFATLRNQLGNRLDLVESSPPIWEKHQAAIWLLTAVPVGTIVLILSLNGLIAVHEEPPVFPDKLNIVQPVIALLSIWASFCYFWTSRAPTFRLPVLEGRYRLVSQTVKEKITYSTRHQAVAPPQVWRIANNIPREVQLSGYAEALFSIDSGGPVWKRSVRALIWYYAPVSLPFLILLLLPILTRFPFAFGYAENYDLALATIAWICWSMPYFIVFSERDLFGRQTLEDSHDARRTDADVFQLDERGNRSLLNQYMANGGQFALQILVIAAAPALLGYFGLFLPPTVPQIDKATTAPVVKKVFISNTQIVTNQNFNQVRCEIPPKKKRPPKPAPPKNPDNSQPVPGKC